MYIIKESNKEDNITIIAKNLGKSSKQVGILIASVKEKQTNIDLLEYQYVEQKRFLINF